jgi:hypothetical protein
LIGNTQEVSYLFETWWKEVELLENELGTALKDKTRYEWSSIRGALERFRRETEPLNNRFLNLAMKRYTSIIEGGASPKSSRARRKTQSAAPSGPDRQAPDASPS